MLIGKKIGRSRSGDSTCYSTSSFDSSVGKLMFDKPYMSMDTLIWRKYNPSGEHLVWRVLGHPVFLFIYLWKLYSFYK